MKSEEDRSIGKINYEKPTALDLGPTAPVVGQSCAPGGLIQFDDCATVGNSASEVCTSTGSSAGGNCNIGSSASNCSVGGTF
ncbi:unnamed protein product [marine sediment metagenome]|uniref:Uncharacterized protein n=1 Tax=marine sediment metagenome TaxID=412755 RepID=X0VA86_9ZZZZ